MIKKILIIVAVLLGLAGLSILVLTPKSVPVGNSLNIVDVRHVDVPVVKSEISLPPKTPTAVPVKALPIASSTTPSSTPPFKKDLIKLDVPFTTQSPFAQWSDLRQENACEESAAIMAVYWAKGKIFTAQEARDMIVAISDWEKKNYGSFEDTSAKDTVDRIFKKYFNYQKVAVVNNIKLEDIITELEKGNLVITPMDGQKLGNPFFTPPGPVTHMLVIIGYDYKTKEFIVNESGTKRGKAYRYDRDVLFAAIRDYPTGNHEPIVGIKKNMIVVRK
ncbi:MAG: C39 family peptidase [Candidatus Falkowbacteria bacterium]